MLQTTTERDFDTGVTTVRLTGDLTLPGLSAIRTAIGKAAGECPTAVIVDLSKFHHTVAAQLSVFATATYEAQSTWGVPVLLCEADQRVTRDLTNFRNFVARYEHRSQAELAVRAYVPRWVKKHFPPVEASAAATRTMVGEACLTWGLMHLRDNARLVASELAANAITHAGTEFDVIAGYTGRFLRIAVRDGSTALPRFPEGTPPKGTAKTPGSGRGLRMVAATGTHWGVTRANGSKTVWVIMQAHHW